MDDFLYNVGRVSSKALIALPPKFKISDVENFDENGDPKQHIRRYLSIAEIKELDEKQSLHAFPLSLMEVHQSGTIALIQAKLRCGTN